MMTLIINADMARKEHSRRERLAVVGSRSQLGDRSQVFFSLIRLHKHYQTARTTEETF